MLRSTLCRFSRSLRVALFLSAGALAQATAQRASAQGATAPTVGPNGPSVDVLGAPVYPGAWFDARNSVSLSDGFNTTYLYLSTDPLATVVAFYTAKYGAKVVRIGTITGNSYTVVLDGRLPAPKRAFSLQRNTRFDKKYQTTIAYTISKK